MRFRPVELADYRGVAACLERNGMSVPGEAEWRRLWDAHPYRTEFADVPRGFVLEDQPGIVGTIFNFWAKYWFRGQSLRAAISGDAAVDPAYRAGSIKLLGETVRQPGVDMYLNGSPSAVASKIMDTLKVTRVPQAGYDVSLLWIANGRRFARAGLRRKGVPLGPVLAPPVGVGLRVLGALRMRRGGRRVVPVRRYAQFDDAFDVFWEALRDQTTRLTGYRDRAMLEWRYGAALRAGHARLLCAERDGALAGYAILLERGRPGLGLRQFLVHDLRCLDEDPAIALGLLQGALEETSAAGLDLLEWVGQAGAPRAVAERTCATRFRLDVWQAFYYTRDKALRSGLRAPDAWAFGPYDSD